MSHKRVFLFEQDKGTGSQVLGFDTGLNSRAFAQAKFAQVITELGLIVYPGKTGGVADWRASGVVEHAMADGSPMMVVWGPPFKGEHLDLLLNSGGQYDADNVLAAICVWIQGILEAEKSPHVIVPFWPCAALIGEGSPSCEGASPCKGGVFFMPPSLAKRCILVPGESERFPGGEWYSHPDLEGMDAAAFTAAAMVYQVFTGVPPFPSVDEIALHQDIREENFLPVHLAVPGLESQCAALIQKILGPAEKKPGAKELIRSAATKNPVNRMNGRAALESILAKLMIDGQPVSAASLVQPLSDENLQILEKERAQFLKANAASVKTRRFIARNKALLAGGVAALIFAFFIIYSIASARAALPTTAGMDPVRVIETYYNAFGELDHQMMEACVVKGAGRDDISAVTNVFVISRVRQAYGVSGDSTVLPASEWQAGGGGPVTMSVFGVTDLRIEGVTMNDEAMLYRAHYTLWIPAHDDQAQETGTALPLPNNRSDLLTLVRKKGNWRISEIIRQASGL
jgi:hypothetical protein